MVLLDNRKDFALTHDDQFFAINFDGVTTGVLTEDNGIANLDGQGAYVAVIQSLASTHSDDFTLVGLFLGGTRQQNATSRGFFFFLATNDHAVMQGTNIHVSESPRF
jgi:hypothetical protein